PSEDWPRGVQQAIEDWLGSGGTHFTRRRDLEAYILTCHPGGILQRCSSRESGHDSRQENPVVDPESMGGYSNAVRRLEQRVEAEEARARETAAELEAAEEGRKRALEDLKRTEEHLQRSDSAIQSMKQSASWRLTAPLRRAKRFLR
ncbi:MAG: hypothetical protein KGR69_14085, partial [Verrucomicrobia bacterium]|nr:hypothetical protein [Verrucomicrobiota bacterium]